MPPKKMRQTRLQQLAQARARSRLQAAIEPMTLHLSHTPLLNQTQETIIVHKHSQPVLKRLGRHTSMQVEVREIGKFFVLGVCGQCGRLQFFFFFFFLNK